MKKLRRSRHQRMIAGVCGGIAEYFNVDPTVVRLCYVLLSVMSVMFPGLLVYILALFIIPKE